MICGVVGAGAWGTALADLLARNGHTVRLWAREPDVADSVTRFHENRRFLPGAALTPTLFGTTVLPDVVGDADLVVYAVPSEYLRHVAALSAHAVTRHATLTVATKGIEPETGALMTDVLEETIPNRRVVALSGPSFAAEVAAQKPTAVVAASADVPASEQVQQCFSCSTFRVYTNRDVIGVGIAGALKNVIAIATGVCDGLGLGANSRAALITRGLAEMTRMAVVRGAQASTFAGLAGIGDLVLTCTGALSRNRTLGEAIGRGATLTEAQAGRETIAEGVVTARSAHLIAQELDIEMPIVSAVNRVLFEGRPVRQAIADLMERELRAEPD